MVTEENKQSESNNESGATQKVYIKTFINLKITLKRKL